MLDNAHNGEYGTDTFIPVLAHTPQNIVSATKSYGTENSAKYLMDYPMIMLVDHVQQIMDETFFDNDTRVSHNMTSTEIMSAIDGLSVTREIYYQPSTNNCIAVVTYNDEQFGHRGKGVAVVDYTGGKSWQILNGYDSGKYNIVTTVFPPNPQYLKKYGQTQMRLSEWM